MTVDADRRARLPRARSLRFMNRRTVPRSPKRCTLSVGVAARLYERSDVQIAVMDLRHAVYGNSAVTRKTSEETRTFSGELSREFEPSGLK